jgi:hypothetical protein
VDPDLKGVSDSLGVRDAECGVAVAAVARWEGYASSVRVVDDDGGKRLKDGESLRQFSGSAFGSQFSVSILENQLENCRPW